MRSEAKKIETLAKKLRLKKSEANALIELVRGIKAIWPDAKFKIFGSKAKGVADEESDLDLLIMLPRDITVEIRRRIIHKVFDINLKFETNISPLIMSRKDWESAPVSLLPIHAFIEEEGILL